MKGERMMRKLIKQSQEAFLLSLELFNKFNNDYRIEGFSFFVINAWELLLKAKIIHTTQDKNAIYYKKKPSEKSLSITDCLKRIFTDEGNLVKANILQVKELRDLAAHLVIPEIENIYIGVLQASVKNYTYFIHKWFGIDLSERFTPGMLALSAGTKELDIIKLKRKYPKEIIETLEKSKAEIVEKMKNDPNHNYSFPIDYKLAYVKNPNKADLVVSLDDDPTLNILEYEKEVPMDTNITYPYRAVDIYNKLQELDETKCCPDSQYRLRCKIDEEGFKKKDFDKNHSYIKATNTHFYSEMVLQFFIKKAKTEDDYF